MKQIHLTSEEARTVIRVLDFTVRLLESFSHLNDIFAFSAPEELEAAQDEIQDLHQTILVRLRGIND